MTPPKRLIVHGWKLGLIAVVAVAAACNLDPDARAPACGATLGTTLDVAVDSIGDVSFSWTPNCKAGYLAVYVMNTNGSAGDELWRVYTSETNNNLGSGVRYGVTPRGAIVGREPVALVPGQRYMVFVGWNVYEAGNTDADAATFTFVAG